MTEANDDGLPRFEATDDPGVRVVDPIEAVEFSIETDGPVDPSPTGTEPFHFPVDVAAEIEASEIGFPYHVGVVVRTPDGTQVETIHSEGERRVPAGRYDIEVSTTPVKLYFHVESSVGIRTRDDRTRFDFGSRNRIRIGVRSRHKRPAATITTTTDPTAVATAITQFSSALKTTSPERSWPTLRGYPPFLKAGDELEIPDTLSPTDTGVELVVRPNLSDLFSTAPLAFYLGASVRIGREPHLRAAGREWSLTRNGDVGATATDVLQRQFTLDCVVRNAGYYDFEMVERNAVAPRLPFDIEDIYRLDVSSRTAAYMDIPRAVVAEAIPRWKLTADVVPAADRLDVLPHLAAELAAVRCPDHSELREPGLPNAQSTSTRGEWPADEDVRAVGPKRSARETWDVDLVYPPRCDSIEHTYLGDGVPVGAGKATVAGYERKLHREVKEETTVTVTIVSANAENSERDAVVDTYAFEGIEPFDTTVIEGASTDKLESVLTADTDFFHYIGHVDERGLQCTDGFLNARNLGSIGADVFLLNGCTSFPQGRALAERGAVGGIVTVVDVFDGVATQVGKTLARLLGQGYSLFSALEVVRAATEFPTEAYTVVGDGSVVVTENESATPVGFRLKWDDGPVVVPFFFPTDRAPLGAVTVPYAVEDDRYMLASGDGAPIETTVDAFTKNLETEPYPVFVDGDLHWSADLTRADIEAWVETARERE